ncbi:MAG: NADH:ubiquinone reductase (Na(+)-transporting) subunit D [Flavobacteriales bacterium]|mgnify:CR=1 FL=1|nr:NADH:ubiquinone reductase (Na(+)-transporting) subunit D [Flavobacteriales bacterium]MCB9180392.1 NADH:ubiquinone reductase (Na(+)-transporting) subunit D [Flavobacteriales bacterium]MCB9200349.1 NADH:ubiquinone reductase (Na(+)-transporting) subunit D [Flavobacteriales bacterium]HPF67640.1 NADH:ubiquinone reductase (Na(+)-transporting) subunit D [Flavobacteriales bacterium]HPJ52506.1 NADH:ubiquinone reductase (Na(+)-transporting) subunit D [Flavobacteriales bacterium]
MSTDTATPAAPKEGLFSKKNRKLITDPLDDNNPITVQVLGICSALAITVKIENALVMSISVLFVLVFGNMAVSALRNLIPSRIRIIAQLVIAAGLVTLVDILLKAYVYDVSKQVGVYVGLIITNCIIMGRFEAYAMGNKVLPSAMDGIGNTLGYAWILVVVAFFRELFGSGTLMGFRVIPESLYSTEGGFYFNNNMMILPPMALVLVGIIIWVQRSRNTKLLEEG